LKKNLWFVSPAEKKKKGKKNQKKKFFYQILENDAALDGRRLLHWHIFVRHFGETFEEVGSLFPLAATEEAGERSLKENVTFDSQRNNYQGDDFTGARLQGFFNPRDHRENHGHLSEPATANLKILSCFWKLESVAEHKDEFLCRLLRKPHFAERICINEDGSVDFFWRQGPVAKILCYCGLCVY